jgi:small-conductance mechanosensitive channel
MSIPLAKVIRGLVYALIEFTNKLLDVIVTASLKYASNPNVFVPDVVKLLTLVILLLFIFKSCVAGN